MLRERHESTSDVAGVIRDVRARWRRKLLVRGALQVLVAGAVILIAAGFALEALRFTPAAILGFRIGTIAAILGLAAWALGRPLLRQVSDEQVALYLEEHEPSLNTLLLSAMSAERNSNPQEHSPALVRKLVEEAVARCQAIDDGRGIEQPLVKRYGLMAAGAFALALAVFTLGPAYLRQGLTAMFSWASVEAAAPYRIALTPGSGTVPRGSDQTFTATLSGFSADDAVLLVRKGDATSFERVPMIKGDDGTFEGMIFDLDAKLEFLAEAAGVRSGDLHPRRHRPAVRPAHRPRVPLPGLHRARAARRRGRRRHRRARRHRGAGHGHADHADAGRAADAARAPTVPLAADDGGKLVGALRRRQGRVLPRRHAGARRPDDHRLAAVRHRRAHRHGADGGHRQARARHQRHAGRGVLRRGPRRRRLRRARTSSSSTR